MQWFSVSVGTVLAAFAFYKYVRIREKVHNLNNWGNSTICFFFFIYLLVWYNKIHGDMQHCKIHIYLLTYSVTAWSRVLLEKLTGSEASQEIPRIFGTRRFINVFTRAHHLSQSWANSSPHNPLPLPEDPS